MFCSFNSKDEEGSDHNIMDGYYCGSGGINTTLTPVWDIKVSRTKLKIAWGGCSYGEPYFMAENGDATVKVDPSVLDFGIVFGVGVLLEQRQTSVCCL